MLNSKPIFIIVFTIYVISMTSAVEYHLKRFPLFAAKPSEFAKVIEKNNKHIVFDPSKNRQFCAIQIEWFDSNQKVGNLRIF